MTKTCAHCAKIFTKPSSLAYWQWETQRFCSHACAARGRSATAVEYRRTWDDGRKRPLHRVLMEQALGRELAADELVHHKNGDKHDNRLENLEVMTALEHGRLHNLKHPLTKTCIQCGLVFTPHKTKRARAKTCGMSCKLALLTTLNQSRSQRKPRSPGES